jgi:hypothetical protein
MVPLDAIDTFPSPKIDIVDVAPPITTDPFPDIVAVFETPPITVYPINFDNSPIVPTIAGPVNSYDVICT